MRLRAVTDFNVIGVNSKGSLWFSDSGIAMSPTDLNKTARKKMQVRRCSAKI